ncbi:hypothetical protein K504DRAFT_465793 [Pleomassaria siparia CBS 279.74]|uniref:Uncharacterized protein n=1 Tax=Pleomassaria siparia CBS 279.74 TaxID=1314801 RepID=A0A6G1KEF4_9PLEO|nr:hypothetical protein K504DRAFT_465793 [Pleomassaria siparia CBS 279.74]
MIPMTPNTIAEELSGVAVAGVGVGVGVGYCPGSKAMRWTNFIGFHMVKVTNMEV